MARIRTIKPEFWEDETIGMLTRDARLMFIAILNYADDEGILRWTPEYVKASVFMYDEDIGLPECSKLMDELVESELVFPYQGGKTLQRLAFVVNFRKHQVINRAQPSKFPFPSLQNPQVREMYARRDKWICHLCKQMIPESAVGRLNSEDPSCDHLIPRSKGGTDAPSNIKITHSSCNKARGNTDLPSEQDISNSVNDSLNDSLNDSVKGSGNRSLLEGEKERERKGVSSQVSPVVVTETTTPPVDNLTERHHAIATAYGTLMARTHNAGSPNGYATRTATNLITERRAELDRYIDNYPTAPCDVIAAALAGQPSSLRYYTDRTVDPEPAVDLVEPF